MLFIVAIDVLLNGTKTPIDKHVFVALLENSVAQTYTGYGRALASSSIAFSDLVALSRHGDIPFTLFFAPLPFVESQIRAKTSKLLSGVSKTTFSINSRTRVDLRDVELIVKDLLRKQELLKKHDRSLAKNDIVGLLAKPGRTVEADASRLMSALGLGGEALRASRDKSAALALMIDGLEANQVLVSQSVSNFMPQRLSGVKFSGMTIKDTKVPYIFLAGGDPGDNQEPTGRRVFTLALMSVLVARRIFAPVTYDGSSIGTDVGREYDIVGAMLMPADLVCSLDLKDLADIKAAADKFKVTPSALTVRAMRLRTIDRETAVAHLDLLAREYASRPKATARQPKAVNAVRKYNGREFSTRMLEALDGGRLSRREFCRSVCLNHIKPSEIDEFRRALR